MNRLELQNAMVAYLDNRTDLAAQFTTFLTLAQAKLDRDLKVSYLTGLQTFTFTAGATSSDDVSTTFSEIKVARVRNGTYLSYVTPEKLEQMRGASVDGDFYSLYANAANGTIRMQLPAAMSATVTSYVDAIVYRKDAVMTSSTDTNITATAHPSLYLYALCAEACKFIRDDQGLALYEANYKRDLEDVLAQDREKAFAGAEQYAPVVV